MSWATETRYYKELNDDNDIVGLLRVKPKGVVEVWHRGRWDATTIADPDIAAIGGVTDYADITKKESDRIAVRLQKQIRQQIQRRRSA